MKTKGPVAVVASLLLLGVPAARVTAGGTLDALKKKGVLVAGVKSACPPFGFRDRNTGALCGYDVDFVKSIAARIGVKPIFTPVTPTDRIPELLEGNIDLIAATMTRTPDRAKLVDFSDAYFLASQKVIAKKGAVGVSADLAGKKVGTAKGSAWEFNLRTKVPGAVVVPFDNAAEAVDALRGGGIDALSADARVLSAILAALPQGAFEIAPATIAEEPYAMAVRKGDTELLRVVNETIREMTGSGEAQRIEDRWFSRESAAAAPGPSAAGVVVRRSGDLARFVVMPMKGIFRPGADASFFDPAGNFVAKGRVKSYYTDEIYVDIDPADADAVDYGFVVVMNLPPDAARDLILKKQDLLKSVTDQVRSENAARQEQIAASEAAMEKQRRREQEEFERQKMQLDYMYDNYYYGWYGSPWW
ncbi:MAG: transporter substrate-binding domain-containing protein [Gemmatimonadota bacterium]